MGAEVSIYLDTRRIKSGGLYPLKLKVYCGRKWKLYQTIYDLSEDDFLKLRATRLSREMAQLRSSIDDLRLKGQTFANSIIPFDFIRFYDQFVYGNPAFRELNLSLTQIGTGKK